MMEPLQGEGGIISPTDDLLKVSKPCGEKHHALLIYDEVQSGVVARGELFMLTWALGIEPDILTTAKALGGGFSPSVQC